MTIAVVFIHGLAEKPAPDILKGLWIDAIARDNPRPEIFGLANLGLSLSNLADIESLYWADVFYGENYETDLSSYERRLEGSGKVPETVEGHPIDNMPDPTLPVGKTPAQKKFLEGLSNRYQLNSTLPASFETPAASVSKLEAYALERFPLPLGVKKAIIKKFALEAFYYLFDEPFVTPTGQSVKPRQELRSRLITLLTKLRANHDKLVMICHSMGTIIAYDCLKNCPECPSVDGLITLGSPLGVDEIQDRLIPEGDNNDAFPSAKLLGPWINVYDPRDPVASLDPHFANDYCKVGVKVVRDIEEENWGNWRHTITKYLKGPKLRAAVREVLGVS
jgi:hypothetical protein